jgi:uncharacterized SAM-binding protein YcdF (DUF218 family)
VSIAGDAEQFAGALARALVDKNPPEVERRIGVARSNSWHTRIDRMSRLVDEAVAEKARDAERWDVRLRRAYRAARSRSVAIVAAVVVTYLLVFETPLVWMAAAPLRLEEPPRRADAIVVFAGGVGESGRAGGGYQERVKQAVDLYNQRFAPRMLFVSGFVFAFHETEVMRSLAIANDVPPAAIELESRADNTATFVRRSVDRAREHGWRRVLLVSSPYHMRRALLTWRRAAPDIDVIAAPVPVSQFYAHERGATLEQIRGIAQEYAAIAWYWWKGSI